MAKFKPGDKVKYSGKFLKSAGMVSDRGRLGVVVDAPTGMPSGGGFISVQWNDEAEPQPIKEMSLMKASVIKTTSASEAHLRDFMNDPKVRQLVKQAKNMKKVIDKTRDPRDWEPLNDKFYQPWLRELEKKTGIRNIEPQMWDVEASTASALSASVRRDICATLIKAGHRALAKRFMKEASFKAAVPGNLGTNTKPSTKQSQKQAVELLKQGGILPPEEKAVDYPVLTARVKKEIIATLLKRKQPKLATWASRNLQTHVSVRNPVRAGTGDWTVDDVIELMNDGYDDIDGIAGVESALDSIPRAVLKKLLPQLQKQDKRWGDWVADYLRGKRRA